MGAVQQGCGTWRGRSLARAVAARRLGFSGCGGTDPVVVLLDRLGGPSYGFDFSIFFQVTEVDIKLPLKKPL